MKRFFLLILVLPFQIMAQNTDFSIHGPDTLIRPNLTDDSDFKFELYEAIPAFDEDTFFWSCGDPDIYITEMHADHHDYKPNREKMYISALSDSVGPNKTINVTVKRQGTVSNSETSFNIQIVGGRFYFIPDCETLKDAGVIDNDEFVDCEEAIMDCWETLPGDDVLAEKRYVGHLVDEWTIASSNLVDPAYRLDITTLKANKIRKIFYENGDPYPADELMEPRDFVMPMPCVSKWFRFGVWEEILVLAQKAKEERETYEAVIQSTQLQITTDNYEMLGLKIQSFKALKADVTVNYGPQIDILAKSGDLYFDFIQTDPAAYYRIHSVEITAASWDKKQSEPWFEISIHVMPRKSRTAFEKWDGTVTYFEESLMELGFQLIDTEGETLSKHTLFAGNVGTEPLTITSRLPLSKLKNSPSFDFDRSRPKKTEIK